MSDDQGKAQGLGASAPAGAPEALRGPRIDAASMARRPQTNLRMLLLTAVMAEAGALTRMQRPRPSPGVRPVGKRKP